MHLAQQRRRARVLLAVGLACALGWLAHLDFSRKITTDLLDLIPPDERMPELMLARSLATAEHARVALFALSAGDEVRLRAAADAFIGALRRSPAFVEVLGMDDTAPRDALARHVFEHRLDLLAPGWLAAHRAAWSEAGEPEPWIDWLAERTAIDLEAFLARAEAVPFQDLLPQDPLLLMPTLASRLETLAQAPASPPGTSLIWARTRDDPLDEAGQQPVFAAVEAALGAARAITPDSSLRWAAISRFAAENRHRIRNEIETLNIISVLAVLGVAAAGLRRIRAVLHLAPVILCAVMAAWVGASAAFDRVHVLVFVVGSLLGGVAIDYGFYLQLQPPLYPDEPYTLKVRRLLRPLLASALTTVLGFTLLVVSDLPLIRQLGVFISAGLLGALAAALLWFAQLRTSEAETRAFMQRPLPGRSGALRWVRRLLLATGAVVALLGPWRVQWRDDVRELEALPDAMRQEATEVRALFGQGPGRTLTVTRGATPAEARTALARFLERHEQFHPGVGVASLGLVLPEPTQWERLNELTAGLDTFPSALAAALEHRGFEPAEFTPFLDQWKTWTASPRPEYDRLVRDLGGALSGPLALTLSTAPGASWFMTVADHPPEPDPIRDDSTIALDRLQSLNDLFLRHRVSALTLSAIGLGLVGASVFWIYGPRAGWRIFLIPVASSLFAFGVFGLTGRPLNLFHLLGAFLGVCLSHNYAIFTAENVRWSDAPAPSVRLSAATTATSFGVLAFSSIPVVSALGATVALVVVSALLLAELAPPTRGLARGRDPA